MLTVEALETTGSPTNDGESAFLAPYVASVTIEGVASLLFHAYSPDSVEAKAKAAKGSAAKKEDDVETYVYRDAFGQICLPGEYLRMAIVNAAKFRQDPRSSRKSAMDLYKASVISLTEFASLGTDRWDYLDRRGVSVNRAKVTRQRPGFNPGWRATVELMVQTPEYISPAILNAVIADAGRLVGVGDFRPTFGRFQVVKFEIL